MNYAKSDNLHTFPIVPFMNEYMDEIKVQYDAILRGKISMDEALKQIKEKIQPLADKK